MSLQHVIKNLLRRDSEKQKILRLNKNVKKASNSNENILFWIPGGMPLMLHVESAIALALKLRGYNVQAVICDGSINACVKRLVSDNISINDWHKACEGCKAENSAILNKLSIKHSYIGDYVSDNVCASHRETSQSITWGSLNGLSYENFAVGKNIKSSIIRYYQGRSLDGSDDVVREYAYSGLVSAESALSAIRYIEPSRIFMSHGTYVDWGPALQIALSRNVPVIAWMASYLRARFFFRRIDDINRIDFHNISDVAWDKCKILKLNFYQNTQLNDFLMDRYQKQVSFDMKQLHVHTGDVDRFRKQYKLVNDLPVWGIMAHINWDAVSDYSPMLYESFDDWMLSTIREAINITDVQWLIKIHPAEAWDNPDSGVQQLIQTHFPALPPHIKVISADDKISPLDFFNLIDGGVTVYGTSGLELALLGKPVILAGKAHYGGKGFSYDGSSIDNYKKLLRKAASITPLSKEQQLLARKYAYCYFIQRQIPLPVVDDPDTKWWKFRFDKSHKLLPGADPFIDFICKRIMDGKDFIMDEELTRLADLYNHDSKESNSSNSDTKQAVIVEEN